MPPLIGITCDIVLAAPLGASGGGVGGQVRERHQCPHTYVAAVVAAGGTPILLPPIPELVEAHARLCAGFVFIGGDDPRTEAFGIPTHPAATPLHPRRQAYELALLAAIDQLAAERSAAPATLGICLGMQLMALHKGGTLNQHLPDTLPPPAAARHVKDFHHPVILEPGGNSHALPRPHAGSLVASNHHQAVSHPGSLRIIARADDGVIEALDDPSRPFYLGVQWHPERTPDAALGQALFNRFIAACGATTSPRLP
ncbi:MAG: gamma-glutamyl-gamma-aminobutyrate hydrolase family protein [Phycisphaerales bacterium]